jgi:hypothetical protein
MVRDRVIATCVKRSANGQMATSTCSGGTGGAGVAQIMRSLHVDQLELPVCDSHILSMIKFAFVLLIRICFVTDAKGTTVEQCLYCTSAELACYSSSGFW